MTAAPRLAKQDKRTGALRWFKPYPAYRDSGIEWLGEIPAHWEVKRLRFVSESNPVPSEVRGLPGETEVSFVPMEAVGEHGGLSLETTKQLADVKAGYTYFRDGDIVIAKITPCFENGKGALAAGLTNGIAFGTTELHVLRATDRADRRFMFYVTFSDAFRRLGEADMYGAGGQKRVSESFVRNFSPALPSLPEQRVIAAFLDRETARIDTLVAKKEQLIALLQEQRTALITRAVTKGLDPRVPMKESGVEWLGKIPGHWTVKRLRHVGEAIIGLTYNPDDVVGPGEGVLVLRASNVRDGRLVYEDNVFVRTTISDHLRTRFGDILICARSGSRDLIGKNARVDDGAVGLTFGTFMLLFRSPCNPFLFHAFNSALFEYQSGTFLTSTINQLTVGNLKDMTVPVPPGKEQATIAAFLDREIARIDTLVAKVHDAINRLKELRSALISAAVTGKIDVREVVA
jgi:type I restriction enzyme, S subunit